MGISFVWPNGVGDGYGCKFVTILTVGARGPALRRSGWWFCAGPMVGEIALQ